MNLMNIYPMLMSMLAEIVLNPDFDANALLKAIVNVFSVGITLVGIISGVLMTAEGIREESPSRKWQGVGVIIFSLLLGGSVTVFLNMVIL